MRTLMVKDLRTTAFYLLLIVPWYLLFVSQVAFLPAGLAECYVILVWIIALAPAILDFINGSEITNCSLPVSRSQIVAGRYLFAAAGAGGCLLLCLVHLWILRALGLVRADAYRWLFTFDGLTAFLAASLLVLGLLLPLTFGLGLVRGVLAFSGLLCAVLMFQVILLWGEPLSSWRLLSPLHSLADTFVSSPIGLLLVWGLLLLGLPVSCRVAGHFYSRRDL